MPDQQVFLINCSEWGQNEPPYKPPLLFQGYYFMQLQFTPAVGQLVTMYVDV